MMQGKSTANVNVIDSADFKKLIKNKELKVFDLRKSDEYISGYIPNAKIFHLTLLIKK